MDRFSGGLVTDTYLAQLAANIAEPADAFAGVWHGISILADGMEIPFEGRGDIVTGVDLLCFNGVFYAFTAFVDGSYIGSGISYTVVDGVGVDGNGEPILTLDENGLLHVPTYDGATYVFEHVDA